IKSLTNEIRFKQNQIKQLNIELGEYSKTIFEGHIETVNKYLKYFTPYIQLRKFSKENSGAKQFVSYSLSVSGETVGFEKMKGGSRRKVKYSLSEGDKSAFAFAFFLANLENINVKDKIVVFDDPISSFDQSRRNATINQLLRISQNSKQLFVLTHDIYFAKALSRKFEKKTSLCLKIQKKAGKSVIFCHDIESETLTGIFKDINVLNNYIKHGAENELEKREVIRCIRPIIEGILRIKYFNEIRRDEWIGDMIGKIESSVEGGRLFRLKKNLDEIVDINSYSKEFHHSDPTNPWGDVINDEELRLYVQKTLLLIDEI
ncbi:MAG: AAA family ATPase, partial [Nodosilinea sp.]